MTREVLRVSFAVRNCFEFSSDETMLISSVGLIIILYLGLVLFLHFYSIIY